MDKQGWVFLGLLAWITSFLWAMTGSQLALWIVIGLTLLAAPFIPTQHTVDGFDHYEDTGHYQDRSGGSADANSATGTDAGSGDSRDAHSGPAPEQRSGQTSPGVRPTRTIVCSNCGQPASRANEDCEVCSTVTGARRK